MRILVVISLLITSTFCKAQSFNLVPIDSANFEIIEGELFDKYSVIIDSIKYEFDSNSYKNCMCKIDSVEGLVSYQSSSVFKSGNKCLYVYKIDSEYYVKVGQFIKGIFDAASYKWKSSVNKIEEDLAKEYISIIEEEIMKAEIPIYESRDLIMIVSDGRSHTFGDLRRITYATTPTAYYSDSLKKLIKLSENLIRKYK